MRIISGKHKSRKLQTLEGLNTRPMTDRMKESVFNTIGPYFNEDIVLDLFGGSGALSLEALSRGCSHAYVVEKSNDAMRIIKNNVVSLQETNNTTLLQMDYQQALKKLKALGKTFDIIFLDPPYKLNIIKEVIEFIIENEMLNNEGIIIAQYVRGNYHPQNTDILEVIKNYSYSVSEVCIYQKLVKTNNNNELKK